MATANVSTLLGDASKWTNHSPGNYVDLLANHLGPAPGVDRSECALNVLNVAAHSPVCLAFVLEDDLDRIYIGHSPFRIPGVPGSPMNFDEHVCVLVGNDLQSAIPVILPPSFLSLTNAANCYSTDYMTGANGHGTAAGPVYRFGTQPNGTVGTNNI